MQKFVLLADRRSGTTLVIDCLNNLPGVRCLKRAFGVEKKIANPTDDNHSGMFFLYRTANLKQRLRFWVDQKSLIRDFLDEEIFAPDPKIVAGGFRLIYHKADKYPGILANLEGNDTRIIHLVRRNVLKTHVSYLTAPLHKMHHPREGSAIRTVTIFIDPATILQDLRKRIQYIERIRKLTAGFPVLEVGYEDFIADRDAEGARIQPFLSLKEIVPFQSDLVKINPDSLEQIIENYDEIREVLVGTEFEEFLA